MTEKRQEPTLLFTTYTDLADYPGHFWQMVITQRFYGGLGWKLTPYKDVSYHICRDSTWYSYGETTE